MCFTGDHCLETGFQIKGDTGKRKIGQSQHIVSSALELHGDVEH